MNWIQTQAVNLYQQTKNYCESAESFSSNFTTGTTRVAISKKKIIPRNAEDMEIFLFFRRNSVFRETENARNSVLNHSAEEKKVGIPFRTIHQKRKSRHFVSNRSAKGTGTQFTLILHANVIFSSNVGCSVKVQSISEFRFVPKKKLQNKNFSETHGIPRKKHFFPRNNGKLSESIPRNFFTKRISMATLLTTRKLR